MHSQKFPLCRPHGGDIFEAARICGCSPEEIMDFSASINPFGPPDDIRMVLAQSLWKISSYPDPANTRLIESASKRFRVDPDMILASNGATELLDVLPAAFSGTRAVIPCPAYQGYEASAWKNRLKVCRVMPEDRNASLLPDLERVSAVLHEPALVFLGRPNNPTAMMPEGSLLKNLLARHPDSMFIVDESFLDFVPEERTIFSPEYENLVVIYSMTKFFALPGLRLGLGFASRKNCRRIRNFLSTWSVNAMAQDAGVFCLENEDFFQTAQKKVISARERLVAGLREISCLDVLPGQANFVLCRINELGTGAAQLAENLLHRYRILIRPADNFAGLDHSFFRVAVKRPADNDYLVSALKGFFSGNGRSKINQKVRRTPAVMVQGTCSGAGKSLMVSALCRILHQDGVRVAPFKSQNMSLNSYVTADGLEMGRAQVVQARACGLRPDVRMNPVLLKPGSDTGSQVIVLGTPVGNMNVGGYISYKKKLLDRIRQVYDQLAAEHQVMVLEGAGSPAEINLKEHDLVNMNMARHARAAVIIAGDIDRGGVFASFAGTMQLLEAWERDLVQGLLINKFRGDQGLLKSAINYISLVTGKEFWGVIPYVHNLGLPEEDSVAFKNARTVKNSEMADQVRIGIIDLPHISNFTDFDPLLSEPDVSVTVIRSPEDLDPGLDVLILPGSKNVPGDLKALRAAGLDRLIRKFADCPGAEVVGICAGLQMLGNEVADDYGLESSSKTTPGLGLLPLETRVMPGKVLSQTRAVWKCPSGRQFKIKGYEIHHGRTRVTGPVKYPMESSEGSFLGAAHPQLEIWGTYLHGIFEDDLFRRYWLDRIRTRKGLPALESVQFVYDIDQGLDRLAEVVRANISLDRVYQALGL
ncbi:MAG: cobyric acid synthase [Desulfonatronovibrionaceae bacterium]